MAGGPGFEPRLTRPERAVLPLDDPPLILLAVANVFYIKTDIMVSPQTILLYAAFTIQLTHEYNKT